MRLVIDTNILISALLTKGTPPDLLYQAWQEGRFVLVTSAVQVVEFTKTLSKPRIRNLVNAYEAQQFVHGLQVLADVAGELPDVSCSSDPDDNKIIATAIAGEADYIVTGDKRHLLHLDCPGAPPIVTARRALEIVQGQS